MAAKMTNINYMSKIIVVLICLCVVNGRKHHLDIKVDDRRQYTLSSFGFLKHGTLTVNITNFIFLNAVEKVSNTTFGFTIDVTRNSGSSAYMEDFPDEKCILRTAKDEADDEKSDVPAILLFRMDFQKEKVHIERRGRILQNLIISNQSIEQFWKLRRLSRREAESGRQSAFSDSYLFNGWNHGARERRAVTEPKPMENLQDIKDNATGAVKNKVTKKPVAIETTEAPQKTTKKPSTVSAPIVNELPMYQKRDVFSFYFLLAVMEEDQEAMYTLKFHNCDNKNENNRPSYSIDIVEVNDGGNYLSASAMPLPTLYFALSLAYVVMAIVWNTVLCKSKENIYKLHYLMLVVLFVKSLSCLFHAINYHFIQKEGIHEEAWAVLFYIAYLTRGALLFVTIILIGAGWAFIKHVLSDREKRLFLIVIPLQILDNIAWIIVEESEEGDSQYTTWKEIFILIDLLCCGAILFPVVWSIRHLQEASRADGKEELSLTKLKLFRQFYIMVVCYIYFTRIIVYLLKMTVPFQYEWLNELFREMATMLFFTITGYKFKPASDNPYLQVPTDDDEEMEMDEVIVGKSGVVDTLKKVNQGNKEDTSGPKLRESSHEYD